MRVKKLGDRLTLKSNNNFFQHFLRNRLYKVFRNKVLNADPFITN